MKDIFEDMQAEIGCLYISICPITNGQYGMKRSDYRLPTMA